MPVASQSQDMPAPSRRFARGGTLCRCSTWLTMAAAIVASLYVHEVGHCMAAWVHGSPAVPTFVNNAVFNPLLGR